MIFVFAQSLRKTFLTPHEFPIVRLFQLMIKISLWAFVLSRSAILDAAELELETRFPAIRLDNGARSKSVEDNPPPVVVIAVGTVQVSASQET